MIFFFFFWYTRVYCCKFMSICQIWFPLIDKCNSLLLNRHDESLKHWLGNIKPHAAAAAAKSLQTCPTLCDPIDRSPPASTVPVILQARTLEWVDISFSNAWKSKEKAKSLSRVWLLTTPWTAAHQAPLSMDFPGKSTGVGCHCLLH